MSPLRLRPDGLRIPWAVIVVFAVGAYALRAALRGWTWAPDVVDLVVFGLLAAILIARPLAEKAFREEDDEEDEPLT